MADREGTQCVSRGTASGVGMCGPLMLVAGFSLVVTGDPNSTFSSILYAPLGLQEMALAVWLLVRGFNPPTGAKARLEVMR